MTDIKHLDTPFNFESLVRLCQQTHERLQGQAERSVNHALVIRNWLIGGYIVEYEQRGDDRAEYGTRLLGKLAERLKQHVAKGVSRTNLKLFRSFYRSFQIGQTPSDQLVSGKGQTPSDQLGPGKGQTPSDLSVVDSKSLLSDDIGRLLSAGGIGRSIHQTLSSDLLNRFPLSWSHYVTLLTIDDVEERSFYEIEADQDNWSVRELERQIASSLYQRLALSRDKDEIRRLATEGQVIQRPADLIKDPLVLEFLDLAEVAAYSESDLESAIIDKLESFLLELGKGFLFEARQRRFTFDNDHFYVDLVFYNRLLRCYVLIDLKLDKLTHGDLGQMQMYVNHFDRHEKLDDENPTIGIVLCARKNDAMVELTLPDNANIFASKYALYLPSKDELKQQLEHIRDELTRDGGRF